MTALVLGIWLAVALIGLVLLLREVSRLRPRAPWILLAVMLLGLGLIVATGLLFRWLTEALQ